jgi:hypothetical protein
MFRRIAIAAVLGLTHAGLPVAGDELVAPLRPYDRIQAGIDAHERGEARRLDAINRQIGWNELFKWQAATQRASSIYYDPYLPGYDYAYGLNAGYGGWFPSALDYRPIWGYGYFEAVRQPIGRREVQTGPNRWESFPIYGDEAAPAVVEPVAPIVPEPARAPTAPRGQEF